MPLSPPGNRIFQMWDYVVDELPGLIGSEFAIDTDRMGITGHLHGRTRCADHRDDASLPLSQRLSLRANCPSYGVGLGAKAVRRLFG